MTKKNERLTAISNELNENIIAVRGTLELAEASVSDGELQGLLLKAVERIDIIQRLTSEMLIALKNIFDKMEGKNST
ncbi:MAG: hypothetical protein A2Y97_03315 [Nitrospirae bacterium RBG_13_39_12]|nr:MAG: hypothetical protein A2Y97_03315 [Nitrospirae bacterium RBG_13_39_12]